MWISFTTRLIANGADVQPPVDEGWGGRFVTLEDPDKYRYFFVTWMNERNGVTKWQDSTLRIFSAALKARSWT